MEKKVLIISYYWPPAGGISVLRSLKVAKYLSQMGWEVIVYTIENGDYPMVDEANFKHIPDNVLVLKQKSFEPFSIYKKLTGKNKNTLGNVLNANEEGKGGVFHILSVWIRANFFIPDARALWIKPSVKYLTQYLKDNPVDVIFSDGPPHSNTVIAAKVSEKTNIPWLMDWQDPWTEVDYYSMFPISKWADKRHKKLEQYCINQASKTTIVSPSWKKDLENLGGKNISIIEWGYDEDDYIGIEESLDEKFLITHLGLLGEDRGPFVFLEVIKELCNTVDYFSDSIVVKFGGTVDVSIRNYVKKLGLENIVQMEGFMPREQALRIMFKSHLQLLLLNKADNAKGRIPGKLFENMRVGRPILCLGPKDSDVENILVKTNSGNSLEYNDKEGIRAALVNSFRQYQKGEDTMAQKSIEEYSVKNLFGKLSEYLIEISE